MAWPPCRAGRAPPTAGTTIRSRPIDWLAILSPCAPSQVWLADLTYIPTGEGWLYLAAILDLHTRKIVGWSMRETLHTEIALEALTMAIQRQRPAPGLIHHSDRGIQYAAEAYRQALARAGITPSMSRKGDCLDNAPMESFFHTLKIERVHHRIYATRDRGPTGSVSVHRGLLQFPPPALGTGLSQPSSRRAFSGLTPSTFSGEDQSVIAVARDVVTAQHGAFPLLEHALASLDRAKARRLTEGTFPTLVA